MERTLGKEYADGDTVIRQGDVGDCMFVIQKGRVEVIVAEQGRERTVARLKKGDFFGEMAVFERELRSATVRSDGPSRILTIDKKNLMRRIHEDPSLAFRMIETMSRRIREMNAELMR